MAENLDLWCKAWKYGQPFHIEVPRVGAVEDLKIRILEALPSPNRPAHLCTFLFKVSLPSSSVNEVFANSNQPEDVAGAVFLNPMAPLREVFVDAPNPANLHVIFIVRPVTGMHYL